MYEKTVSLIMAGCLLLLMTACGANPSSSYGASDTPSSEEQEESSSSNISETSAPAESPSKTSEPSENGKEGFVVYFTSDISPEGMLAVFEALGWRPTGNVAVKLSTGEPPASNYLRPELVKDVVDAVGTIVECNTAYGGSRSETAMHYQVAEDRDFTGIADFQILDEDGSMTLPVEGGSVLTENYVDAAFALPMQRSNGWQLGTGLENAVPSAERNPRIFSQCPRRQRYAMPRPRWCR